MPRPLGTTTVRLLAAIRDGTRYGLDLVTATGLPSGTVYPTLARMRSRGLVASAWEDQEVAEAEGRPRRRYYRITPEGSRALADGVARYRSLVAEVDPEAGKA